MTKPIKKVSAYIVRQSKENYDELLVFSHKNHPDVPIQIPGGTVDNGEGLKEALKRKVYEETGLKNFEIIKKVGESTYFKLYLGKEVNRHYFLIRVSSDIENSWEHEVVGKGEDKDLIFSYQWFHPQEVLLIHNEFHKFLTPEYIPSLFPDEVMIGLSNNKISLMPDTKLWRELFEKEKSIIEKRIGRHVDNIQHIGSTSIPLIPAKPIIDIGIGVKDIKEKSNIIIDKLEEIGYEFKGERGIPDRYYFVKGSPENRTHYLHMYEKGHTALRNCYLFRDYLKNNKKFADKYAKLKLNHWRKYKNNREKYTEKKSDFIKEVLEKAGPKS